MPIHDVKSVVIKRFINAKQLAIGCILGCLTGFFTFNIVTGNIGDMGIKGIILFPIGFVFNLYLIVTARRIGAGFDCSGKWYYWSSDDNNKGLAIAAGIEKTLNTKQIDCLNLIKYDQ